MSVTLHDKLNRAAELDQQRKHGFGARLRSLRESARLSRRELERLSRVPERTIVDLERADKSHLDRRTVHLLAHGLGLDAVQEREFFSAAGLLPDMRLDYPDVYGVALRFYREAGYPAFMIDGLFDVHSCNSYLLSVLGLTLPMLHEQAYRGAGPNLLRVLFDPVLRARELWRGGWREIALASVCAFRMTSQAHLNEPRFAHLLRELLSLPDFTRMWSEAERAAACPESPYVSTLYTGFGAMRVLHGEALTHAAIQPHLRACVYVPIDDATTRTIDQLRMQTGKFAIQFDFMERARFSRIV